MQLACPVHPYTRCGSNMIGAKSKGRRHYICGSSYYRKDLGCAKGVYIPQEDLKSEVITGMRQMLPSARDMGRDDGQEIERIVDLKVPIDWLSERLPGQPAA